MGHCSHEKGQGHALTTQSPDTRGRARGRQCLSGGLHIEDEVKLPSVFVSDSKNSGRDTRNLKSGCERPRNNIQRDKRGSKTFLQIFFE